MASAQLDPRLISGLVWRNIGPFRGGRVSAVGGAVGQAGTFYIGLPQGGVWKTTSAGQTWYPVFDSIQETSCVGSVAVAATDANVVYAGTGEISGNGEGFGVYKSNDAGKTWQHLGLEKSGMIPTVLVDPHNPDLALLATTGKAKEHGGDRGVYRTADGGKTWTQTLAIDQDTGVQHLSWAIDHPEVILATSMHLYIPPGVLSRGVLRTFTADLYKSTDEGLTWKKLEGKGLPKLVGRVTTAVAMNTNAQRMYLIGTFGLYRSDDGGDNWHQMAASDHRIANGQGFYTSGVYVDPKNPDVVYTLATCSYRSLDGGKTFTGFKGAPGGDDPQQMWIDPTDGNRVLLGGDQGAVVSLDSGATWGSWYNQATGQIYHVTTDTQYPYWVYGAQQDSGAIMVASRGNLGQITFQDWAPHPGYEFGYLAVDPLNPKVSYGYGPGGGIIKVTYPSGQWISVNPAAEPGEELRQGRDLPVAFSPVNPHELLTGFQYLMSSTDGGMHWKRLSPDLGIRKDLPPPPKNADFFARRFNPRLGSIESFSQSTVDPKVFWVGTSNGMVKMTKDHGANWADVSPTGVPNQQMNGVACVEASRSEAGEAYVVFAGSFETQASPFLFRTRDFGKTWTRIVAGLPENEPAGSAASAVRSDPLRKGLLFASTRSAIYVSFDDGDHWQSLKLNLPTTEVSDITIHGNDLVISTYGRGFWILDDFSPLREIADSIASEPAHLLKPGVAMRVRRDVNDDTPFPPEIPRALNPPLGAIIYYWLGSKPAGRVSLDILDATGAVVRHMSSDPIEPYTDPPPAVPDFWVERLKPLPTEAGLNRINWNLRYDKPHGFVHDPQDVMGAIPGDTPAGTEGPIALPGEYTARLTVDGQTYTEKFEVKNDPRSPAKPADLRAQMVLQRDLLACAEECWTGFQQVGEMRAAVAATHSDAKEVTDALASFDKKLAAVQGKPAFERFFGMGGGGGPTFVGLNGELLRGLGSLDFGDMAPTDAMYGQYAEAYDQLQTLLGKWKALNSKDLSELNVLLKKNGLQAIHAAVPMPNPPEPPARFKVKPGKSASENATGNRVEEEDEGG